MADKNALAIYRRILRIDRLLSDGSYPTLEDLKNDHDIEASRATIYRTIEYMRDQLNAPIAKDYETKGFYYTDKTFRLPYIWTTEQELYAITTLKNMLDSLEGTPLFESTKQILELIENSPVKNPMNSFEIKDGDSRENIDSTWISNRYVFLDQHHSEVEKIVWNNLEKAMHENKIIEFNYTRKYDEESELRKVKPYQILKSREDWTLWAFDINRNDFRLFTLNRIRDIKITKEKFILPNDFEYEKHSQEKNSVWYNANETDFKIWLSDKAMDENQNYIWGKNQTITETDGGFEISFTSANPTWVMQKLLSLAEEAIPLEPKDFCEEYYDHVDAMSRK